jgi:uncharacterized PurR-regulated membrane protein YhhQ (DUF165 family)
MTLAILVAWYVVEVIGISITHRLGEKCVGFAVLVNMLLVFTIGKFEVEIFGWHTNAANVAYASVFYGMSLVARDRGFIGTTKLITAVFLGSAAFLLAIHMLQFLPIVVGNEVPAEFIFGLFKNSGQVVVAAGFAFWLSNLVNLYFVTRGQKVVGNVLGQLVDSAIFFPVAFSMILPTSMILEFSVTGFILKAALNVLDTPLFHSRIVRG